MENAEVNAQFVNLLNGGDAHPLFDQPVEVEVFDEMFLEQDLEQDLLDICSNVTMEDISGRDQDLN